jgi:hypothetical protein
MLDGFGIARGDALLPEAVDPTAHAPRMGVADNPEWGWTIEQFTAKGSTAETLSRLTARGHEALSLAHTQTVSSFLYAADGSIVTGFDLTVPSIRYGSDPHRFDNEMARAGLVAEGARDIPAASARFLRSAFRLDLSPEMVETVARVVYLPDRRHD